MVANDGVSVELLYYIIAALLLLLVLGVYFKRNRKRKRKRGIMKPLMVAITVRITMAQDSQLRRISAQTGKGRSALIREAITALVNAYPRREE
jgi:hypothetical protein